MLCAEFLLLMLRVEMPSKYCFFLMKLGVFLVVQCLKIDTLSLAKPKNAYC